MKSGSGRKKSEQTPQQPAEEENAVEAEEEEQEEENDDEEGYNEEDENEEDIPKLEEGFYEIEDIRRKRVCKGQLQYLIKWRGWPETANTWEPLENLQSCSDIILAFEQSMKASKSSKTQRKRKNATSSQRQSKKKRQQQPSRSSSLPGVQITPSPQAEAPAETQIEAVPFPSLDNSSPLSQPPHINGERPGGGGGGGGGGVVQASENKDHVDAYATHVNGNGNNVPIPDHPMGNGSSNTSVQDDLNTEPNHAADPISTELKDTSANNSNSQSFSIHIPGTILSNNSDGLPEANHMKPDQTNRVKGAKRRKSGCVRRFKQDPPPSCQLDESPAPVAIGINESGQKTEAPKVSNVEGNIDDVGDKNDFDGSVNPSVITKLIKATSFETSISDNKQDVSITFKAVRSDGSEASVDNKYLKANNPDLLISFYEQHLRYQPPK